MAHSETTPTARLAAELAEARAEIARLRAKLGDASDEQAPRWRQMLDAIDGIVFEYDVDADRFVYVSARAEGMLGFTLDEWCAPNFWSDHVHPDDLDGAMTACVRAIEERRDHELEYRMIGRFGRVAWLHDYCTVVEDEGRIRLFGVMVDVTPKKRVESLMVQVSGRLSALLANLAAGVLFGDSDGRISFANTAFCRLFGLHDPNALVGEPAARVMARIATRFTESERFLELANSLPSGGNAGLSQEFTTLHGGVVEVSHAPVHLPGESAGHLWQFTDVTASRSAERTMRRIAAGTSRAIGDEFFKALVEHVAGAMGARWAVVSERLEHDRDRVRMLAVWDHDRLIEPFELSIPGGPCEITVRDGMAFFPGTLSDAYPEHVLVKQLGVRTYLGAALRGSTGEPLGVLAVLHDGPLSTTLDIASILAVFAGRAAAELERKHAEAALRSSETRHRALLEALPDLMFLMDAGGTYLDFHASDRSALLAPPEAFLGKHFRQVLPPHLVGQFTQMHERVLRTGEPQMGEYTVEVGGRARRYEARMVACGPDRVLAIARDIEQQYRLKEELAQAQKMESIGRLAGGVAHDFNNLLTGILGYAELGQQALPASTAVSGYFGRIRGAAERAADLTNQLLAFARKQIVEPRVISPAAAIAEMQGFMQRVIGEDVELATELTQDTWRVRIDPTQFQQVLLNLLVNARDALPEGGHVRISTSNVHRVPRADAATAPLGGSTSETGTDWVCISVVDDGIGMSSEALAHAFEPFFTTKPAGRGTGMGLATCYGIVSQHGGHIEIASQLGEGTRVDVLLPRVDMPTEAHAPRSEGMPHGTERVLLVEDEATVRDLVLGVLQSLGYEVRAAEDAEGARAVWRESRGGFDVLVTDVIMPSETGASLADALRAERPGLRVLYVSGYAASSVAPERLAGPGVAFLAKPFSVGELARRLRALLDAPR
ncbi:MAG: PAS domain S-box protein [Planctomycetes bacterium]|nr:PAS domain S-box protein [Planctomycetota bacterium]